MTAEPNALPQTGIEQAVSALAAQGESTLVLHTGGRTEKGAMKMLPKLPPAAFVEAGAPTEAGDQPEAGDPTETAIQQAVKHGLKQVVFVGTADRLAVVPASPGPTHLLGEITTDMGGPPELAADVARAGSARSAYELWEAAGRLGPCGRELCRRVALALEGFAVKAGGEVPAQVVLVDFTGERMVGMYGRLAR